MHNTREPDFTRYGIQLLMSCVVLLQSEALSKGAEKLLHRYVVSAGKAFKHLAVSTLTGAQRSSTAALDKTVVGCMVTSTKQLLGVW